MVRIVEKVWNSSLGLEKGVGLPSKECERLCLRRGPLLSGALV